MKKYYELSAPQKSIWFMEQYYKNTNVNNVCGTFLSNEKLDFNLFSKAVNIFLKNNDSFKIKLKLIDGEIKQYFSELDDINFKIVNIKNEEEQRNLEEQTASEVFDLLDSFLFKIILFRYPDNHGGFVINSHHIISDSWTNGLVANDIALIYDKFKKGETYTKDEKLSYKTYLQSENEYMNSSKFEKDKEYWNNVFNTLPENATIPFVKDTSSNADDISARRLLLNVDNKLLTNLKKYCEENKVSLYNFFMAIFAVYLGRVSNLNEFVIGTPILNRSNFKEKQTTGMFINTLPLKINLKNNETFLENLKEIAINSMSLLRHQKYSFQYILEDLRKKDSSLPKLYNVLYSYQITKMNENEEALNHTTSWTFNQTTTDDLDIHMYEWNENDSIKIAYDYQLCKYDEKDIKNIHKRILHIIKQVVENLGIKLNKIEIVTPEEKNKILYDFNNTNLDYPKNKNLIDLFKNQVKLNLNNISVIFKDNKITYKELDDKSNSLAYLLNKKGVRPGDIVGVCLEKGIDLIISIWGILKCGAVYMPMYTGYPKDRLYYMISNSNSKYIIVNNSSSSLFDDENVININSLDLTKNTKDINIKINSDTLAYIIYTSGSTGKPKGVKISHKNLINFVFSFNKYYNNDISSKDRFLSSTNMAFDVSIWEFFMPLLNGAKLIFNTEEIITDISLYCENIINNKITALYIPPNILNEVHTILSEKKYSGIAKLLVGVEAITNTTLNKYIDLNPEITIVNGYGPTETTICATAFVYRKDISYTHNVPIGKPLYNNKVYILSQGKLCPTNVPGELYVSGDGVGKGYLNDETKTKLAFKDDIFFEGMKMYSTGDLAYLGNDNNIHFIGRRDNQIKLHGYRIELNEIDYALSSHPEISKSLSIVLNNSIVNYYISNEEILENDLKQFLKDKLPFYMIPNVYIRLDKFPLTVNGKIDNRNLPMPKLRANTEYIAPKTNIEKLLCDIWCKIFNREKISITDNFFELGGDSLTAIKFQTEALNHNIKISYKDIFSNPTIIDLAKFIDNSEIHVDETTGIENSKKQSYYNLSSAQKRIYYSCLKDTSSLSYNISGGIILDKVIDKNKLERCFKKLIKRHSSLRTYFINKNDGIVQIIKDSIDYKLDYDEIDTSDLNLVYSDFVKPFDLSKAPLFRTKLVKLNNNKELLLLDMHHIISDGTSLNILLEELSNLYNGKILSDKNIYYKDFVIWENKQLAKADFQKQKDFWVNQFNDEIPLLNMPSTYPRPNTQSFEGANYFETLENDKYNKILETAKKLNVTPYMLLLSVYYITLSKYTSQDEIIVGTPVMGRESPELSNLVGMFVNSLPIKAKIDTNLTFKEFCSTIKNICAKDFMYQSYPYDMIVNDLNIKRDTSRNPLFDTMFIYQNEGYPNISFDGITSQYFIPNNQISKFDISLEILPQNNEFKLRFEYCTKLFDNTFIKRFSNHYINIINCILNNNDLLLSNIDMLSDDERKKILYDFNDTDRPINNTTFVDLFEKQVLLHPKNIALICDNKSITYSELNKKANSLAHFLLSNGIKENDIVAIMTNRSIETIVSMLAVLKSGATFVNMDPTYPIERTTYYLKDCQAKYVLKQKDIELPVNLFDNIFNIDLTNKDIYSLHKENPNIKIDLSSMSYIIYTSGSTGNPKGVVLNHKGLANMCNAMTLVLDYLKDATNHTLLSVTSTPFDIFVYEIVVPLSHGMKIVIANNKEHRNPKLIDKLIRKYNVDVMTVTPSLMKINYDNREKDSALALVKNMVFGGEPLSEKFVLDLKALSSDITIYNIYGPSEITVLSNVQNLDGEKIINVGPPILNTKEYILDKDMNPVPIGVTGEIYIGGIQVGYGYLGNEDLTNQKFIRNPFDNGMMFKSGDLGKWTEDGKLQCLGRLDFQVKLRGLRIELNEVEKALESISEIEEAVVNKIMINNKEALCGYYVSNTTIDDKKIRRLLSKKLPAYMIPTYFINLDSMPYTLNRKIDRKALPLPNIEENQIINNIEISTLESDSEKLLSIWKKILNTDNITINDNFFDLGGDSIAAIDVQIEAIKYGIEIQYSDIFKYPTVEQLVNILNKNKYLNISEYNNNSINSLLNLNDKTVFSTLRKIKTNNIMIIGTTGYLGIHLLNEFLENNNGIAYCLVRPKDNITPNERLENNFDFYFGKDTFKKYNNRIKILKGDITETNIGLSSDDVTIIEKDVDTIINSGALVKHYGRDQLFEEINVIGTQNVVDFCSRLEKRLLHISTISVSGNGERLEDYNQDSKTFSEKNLYIDQKINGIYTYTKLKAEYIVLNAINTGLNAMIFRVGNITNRYSDGLFQQNINDNAFAKRLKSFIEIGAFPNYFLEHEIDWTPVDLCAKAIIKNLHYQSNCNILHIYNNRLLDVKKIYKLFQKLNIDIIPVSNNLMSLIITGLLQDINKKNILSGIIYDIDKNKNLIYTSNIKLNSDFSVKYLRKIGFKWKNINSCYLKKCFNYFKRIGFINF